MIFIIILVVLSAFCIWARIADEADEIEKIKKKEQYEIALQNAKLDYEDALNGKDKIDALQKGRHYYALLRHVSSSDLSKSDEERIALSIQSMNTNL